MKKLSARSDRVKCVDLHPTEPWVLAALYSGNIFLWDTETSSLVKSWEVCDLPVRSCKFIARRSQFISASDDMRLRIYNYNTMEKIKDIEAHADYIRFVEIHPTMPYIMSSSDDMSMKLWNWEQNWECLSSFEGHSHYVMMCKFNPKDTNTLASASLDRTIKVWGLGAQQPHFSLEGHERGVNCLDYYPGGDKPYLITGADDKTVKVWDYQTKACIQTLEGHSNNVCSVLFHPRLPVLISASEDGTVRIWHSMTYRAETTLNYGLERAWSLAAARESNELAIGYDEGTVLIKLGHDAPVASLDTHTGKLVWAYNNDIQSASLKGAAVDFGDGEKLNLTIKDMGSCEIFPQTVQHNCNGRFLVMCGDGEYIIYTSQALRNKTFGQALDFAWSAVGTGDFAIRESMARIKVFKNFKEHRTIHAPISSSEGLFGGACIAIKGPDCVVFFDWAEGAFLCKIDVAPSVIYWNETQELVLLVCDEQAFVLNYKKDLVEAAINEDSVSPELGVPGAFEPEHELLDGVTKGQWIGDCFIFSNSAGRLNYFVGGNTMVLCHLDQQGTGPLFMLGYLPKEDRVYLMDRSRNVFSYRALLAVLQYQTAVVRHDFDMANAILPAIPESEHSSVARFLEAQGYKDVALQVSRDPDHQFDLSLDLGKLKDATQLLDAEPIEDRDLTETMIKWKRLGDLALANCDLALAERCASNSRDLAGLLMLYTAAGNRTGIFTLAGNAVSQGKFNIAFVCFFILGEIEKCFELLLDTNRVPEAALLARTYLPSQISRAVSLWRLDLKQISDRAAASLADPAEYPNLFPDLDWALKVEEVFKRNRTKPVPAAEYINAKDDIDLDLIALLKQKHTIPEDARPTSDSAEDIDIGLVSQEVNTETESSSHATDSPYDPLVKPKDLVIESSDTATRSSTGSNIDSLKGKQISTVPALSVDDEANAILEDDFNNDDDDW
jgi:coatomer subunit beta'